MPLYTSYNQGPGLLALALSSITSPVPPKVVIIYREYDFAGLKPGWYEQNWDLCPGRLPPWLWHDIIKEETSWQWPQFRILHEVHEVRNFRLELCADVWGDVAEYAVEVLRQIVEVGKARRVFNKKSPEPLVSCRPRISHREYLTEVCSANHPYPWVPL